MSFIGDEPVRTKICIDNACIEQELRHFNYLGRDITYDQARDIENKVTNFTRICGPIWRTLKNKCRTENKP